MCRPLVDELVNLPVGRVHGSPNGYTHVASICWVQLNQSTFDVSW